MVRQCEGQWQEHEPAPEGPLPEMHRADEQGVDGLLQVQPRSDEAVDVPAVPQRKDEESEGSAMDQFWDQWWVGFVYGAVAVSVAEVVLAVGIALWLRHRDRKAARRAEARIRLCRSSEDRTLFV